MSLYGVNHMSVSSETAVLTLPRPGDLTPEKTIDPRCLEIAQKHSSGLYIDVDDQSETSSDGSSDESDCRSDHRSNLAPRTPPALTITLPPSPPISPKKPSRAAAIRKAAIYSSSSSEAESDDDFEGSDSSASNFPVVAETLTNKRKRNKPLRVKSKVPVKRDGPARKEQNKRAQSIYREKKKELSALDRKYIIKFLRETDIGKVKLLKRLYLKELAAIDEKVAAEVRAVLR